jgi:hypothetical protein
MINDHSLHWLSSYQSCSLPTVVVGSVLFIRYSWLPPTSTPPEIVFDISIRNLKLVYVLFQKAFSKNDSFCFLHRKVYCKRGKSFKGEGTLQFVTDHEGPDGGYRYSSTISLTSALVRGRWSAPSPGRFTPENETRYPFYRMLDGPQVWTAAEILAPPGLDSQTIQPVASRSTNYARRGLPLKELLVNISIVKRDPLSSLTFYIHSIVINKSELRSLWGTLGRSC